MYLGTVKIGTFTCSGENVGYSTHHWGLTVSSLANLLNSAEHSIHVLVENMTTDEVMPPWREPMIAV